MTAAGRQGHRPSSISRFFPRASAPSQVPRLPEGPEPRGPLARLRAADGAVYEFRLLGPEDSQLVVSFYSSLDTVSLYYRFLGVFRDFESHARRLFSSPCNYAVGAFAGGSLVAEGEGFSDCADAELAFAVMPEHRRRGLATVIAALLVLEAHRRGMRTMEAYMHAENEAAIRIGNRLGLRMCPEEGGVFHGKAELEAIRGLALKAIRDKGAELLYPY